MYTYTFKKPGCRPCGPPARGARRRPSPPHPCGSYDILCSNMLYYNTLLYYHIQ